MSTWCGYYKQTKTTTSDAIIMNIYSPRRFSAATINFNGSPSAWLRDSEKLKRERQQQLRQHSNLLSKFFSTSTSSSSWSNNECNYFLVRQNRWHCRRRQLVAEYFISSASSNINNRMRLTLAPAAAPLHSPFSILNCAHMISKKEINWLRCAISSKQFDNTLFIQQVLPPPPPLQLLLSNAESHLMLIGCHRRLIAKTYW